MKVNTHP